MKFLVVVKNIGWTSDYCQLIIKKELFKNVSDSFFSKGLVCYERSLWNRQNHSFKCI